MVMFESKQMSRVGSGSHGTAGRKGGKAEGGKAVTYQVAIGHLKWGQGETS